MIWLPFTLCTQLNSVYAEKLNDLNYRFNPQVITADSPAHDLSAFIDWNKAIIPKSEFALKPLLVASNNHQNFFRTCTSEQLKKVALTREQICLRNKFPCRQIVSVTIKTKNGNVRCLMPSLSDEECGSREVPECKPEEPETEP